MRYAHLLLATSLVLSLCVEAKSQSISQQSTDGSTRITRNNPLEVPLVQDPNLVHIGIQDQWRDPWRAIAPVKNLPPAAIRVVGKEAGLHVALFNYKEKDKRASSMAFQLRPFADKRVVEIHVFAVEQDGRPVARTQMSNPQSIPLKKQGATLPFTIAMNEGETLTCEILFMVNGQELGMTRIRMDHRGISFAPEVKASGKKSQ